TVSSSGIGSSSGSITVDSTLSSTNGTTYAQVQHQVVTWNYVTNQTITDLANVTVGVAAAAAGAPAALAGTENDEANDTWTRHTDGTLTETTDQTAAYANSTWTIGSVSINTHREDEFTDSLVNHDGSDESDQDGGG